MSIFISWILFLGSATVVKALFLYLDELSDKVMSQFFEENMPMTGGGLGHYADIFSLGLSIVFAGNSTNSCHTYLNWIIFVVAIALGAKESSWVNNIFTTINLLVVITVIISGLWKGELVEIVNNQITRLFLVNASNWSISEEEVPPDHGTGGFAPYGVKGVIQGAARCFFGFIGFDCIATAGEEARTPQKSIPIAVVVSLLIVFFAYFGISTVLTMMWPYFLQVRQILYLVEILRLCLK
jgi:cationic amino acid transporter 2